MISAICSLKFPILGIIPILSFSLLKHRDDVVFDTITTSTDYISVIQFSILLFYISLFKIKNKLSSFKADYLIVFMCLLIFLASYYKSGLGKISLLPYFSWLASNPTFSILERGWYLNAFPTSVLPSSIYTQLWNLLKNYQQFINVSALLVELSPIFIIIRPKNLFICVPFYLMFHLIVYLCTGVFFYKWMIFLVIIAFYYKRFSYQLKYVTKTSKAYLFCLYILIAFNDFSGTGFKILNLSWFDSPAVNKIEIYAVTKDKLALVPYNYFLSRSFSILANRYAPAFSNRFPQSSEGPSDFLELKKYINHEIYPKTNRDFNFETYRAKLSNEILSSHKFYQNSKIPLELVNLFPFHIRTHPDILTFFKTIEISDILYYVATNNSGYLNLDPKKKPIVVLGTDTLKVKIN